MEAGYKIKYVNPDFLVPKLYTEFCQKETFTDVTLVSDDLLPISAHRIVLGAASPVLQKLLTIQEPNHPILYLRGIKHDLLQLLLHFVYNGEVNVKEELIESFMKIAAELEIKELSQNISSEKLKVSDKSDENDGNSEGIANIVNDQLEDDLEKIYQLSLSIPIKEQKVSGEGDEIDGNFEEFKNSEAIASIIDDLSEDDLEKIKDICVKNLDEGKTKEQTLIVHRKEEDIIVDETIQEADILLDELDKIKDICVQNLEKEGEEQEQTSKKK